jgi:hypothetical protein
MVAFARSILPVLTAVLLAAGLAACTSQLSEDARRAQTALIGMPKQVLLQCAGAPTRSYTAGNREFFTYERSRSYYTGSVGVGVFRGYSSFGYGFNSPLYGSYDTDTCIATFTLENDRVIDLVYGGNAGSRRLPQCYYIVENCLKGLSYSQAD